MTKYEYLAKLESSLANVNKDERNEILSDIAEHFENELRCGKTEGQISAELGDPVTLALSYTDGKQGAGETVTHAAPPISVASAGDTAKRPYVSPFQPQNIKKKASPAKIVGYVFLDFAIAIGVIILASLIISGFAVSVSLVVGGGAYLLGGFLAFTSVAMGVGTFLASAGLMLMGIFLFRVFISSVVGLVKCIKKLVKKQCAAIKGEC